jgi:hypothetical protein
MYPMPRPQPPSTLGALGGVKVLFGKQVDLGNGVPATVEFEIVNKERCVLLAQLCTTRCGN